MLNKRILVLMFVVAFLLLVGCGPPTTVPNRVPIITSDPITTATVGEAYTYDVNATDPDGDTLTYSLATPVGMTINSASGLIMWIPTSAQVGNNLVTVMVSDGALYITQSFTIVVSEPTAPPVNHAPNINSIPVTTATVGVTYFYGVNATDPDNDILNYFLTACPSGMVISSNNGLIWWTPIAEGAYAVVVEVSDGALSDTQPFTITVSKPTVPPKTYTITASAGPGGSISPLGDVTVNKGANIVFTITPNTNYNIADVLVDWVSVGAISTYTFNNVGKDHTIHATFSAIEPEPEVELIAELTILWESLIADLKPEFAPGVYEYSLAATYNENAITLTATTDLEGATIEYNYEYTQKGTVAGTFNLLVSGKNIITITVKKDGYQTTTYTVIVTRASSPPLYPVHNVSIDKRYETIQEAINDVDTEDGHTIIIAAGTYDEQVFIDKSLTLQGVGDTTVIQPPAVELAATSSIPWIGGGIGTMSAIVSVETAGGTVNIKDLKIDGSLIPSKATAWVGGLVYLETSGIIDSVTVIGNPTMPDRTAGIFGAAITNSVSLEVTWCTVQVYTRAGIYALGGTMTADYNNNEINGPGPILVGVPNGMFFLEGATGSATYNTVTYLGYTGETYKSTGIGTYNAGTDVTFGYNTIFNVQNAFALAKNTIGTIVEYNDIHDCHTSVKIESNSASNIIQYNEIYDNDFAIRGGEDMGDGNNVHYNNFVNNPGLEEIVSGETYIGAVCNIHDTYSLDATHNWWGHASGPSGVGPGSGDTVSDNVDFEPWSNSPH